GLQWGGGAEGELGWGGKVEVLAKPVPDEAAGAGQGGQRPCPLRLVPQNRHEDLRGPEIARRLDLSHRHEPESRVLELPLQEGRDLLLHELIDALEPLALPPRI